jgi:hypothetical protein
VDCEGTAWKGKPNSSVFFSKHYHEQLGSSEASLGRPFSPARSFLPLQIITSPVFSE